MASEPEKSEKFFLPSPELAAKIDKEFFKCHRRPFWDDLFFAMLCTYGTFPLFWLLQKIVDIFRTPNSVIYPWVSKSEGIRMVLGAILSNLSHELVFYVPMGETSEIDFIGPDGFMLQIGNIRLKERICRNFFGDHSYDEVPLTKKQSDLLRALAFEFRHWLQSRDSHEHDFRPGHKWKVLNDRVIWEIKMMRSLKQ